MLWIKAGRFLFLARGLPHVARVHFLISPRFLVYLLHQFNMSDSANQKQGTLKAILKAHFFWRGSTMLNDPRKYRKRDPISVKKQITAE